MVVVQVQLSKFYVKKNKELNESVEICTLHPKHSGNSVTEKSGTVVTGKFDGLSYYIYDNNNKNDFTFYGDGSFTYNIVNPGKSKIYFGNFSQYNILEKNPVYFDFVVDPKNVSKEDNYYYFGVHGVNTETGISSKSHVSFDIVENFVGDQLITSGEIRGTYTIDGDQYELYEYVMPKNSIPGPFTGYTHLTCVRKESRTCGTVDVSAHVKAWEKFDISLNPYVNLSAYTNVDKSTTGPVDVLLNKIYKRT